MVSNTSFALQKNSDFTDLPYLCYNYSYYTLSKKNYSYYTKWRI